jgi:hypothetical protein
MERGCSFSRRAAMELVRTGQLTGAAAAASFDAARFARDFRDERDGGDARPRQGDEQREGCVRGSASRQQSLEDDPQPSPFLAQQTAQQIWPPPFSGQHESPWTQSTKPHVGVRPPPPGGAVPPPPPPPGLPAPGDFGFGQFLRQLLRSCRRVCMNAT